MAICMAQAFPGVSVDTLTLSEEQAHLARQRIADIGLGPRPCQRCVDAELLTAESGDVQGSMDLLYDEGRKRAPGCCCEQPRVRVHLMDYRSMPKEWEGVFDRVVSVEMIEAVGQEFLEVRWLERGLARGSLDRIFLSVEVLGSGRLGLEEGHWSWGGAGDHPA